MRFVSKNEGMPDSLTAGRVEIFFAGRWGTICSYNFTISDATALCRFMTGSTSVVAYSAVGQDNLQ